MPPDTPGLDDFAAYATAHGLALEPDGQLPRTTPLLAEGELRGVEALMRGWLGTYLEAQIAIVSREETTTNPDGGETTGEAHFTVAVTHVPKAKRFVPWMLCHRAGDEHLLGRAAEELIHGNDRLDLESAELDRCYRIYAAPERDEVWLRELFSPSFIVFLIDLAPKGFAFEYVEGTLCSARSAASPLPRTSTASGTPPSSWSPAFAPRSASDLARHRDVPASAAGKNEVRTG